MHLKRNSSSVRSNKQRGLKPRAEMLEMRELLAVDLSLTNGPAPGPYGIGVTNTGGGSFLGEAVAIIGDINGDGYQDMAATNPTQNYTALIFGSKPTDYLTLSNADRLTTINNLVPNATAITGFRLTSSDAGSQFGTSVKGVGDINGDGFADFMIGAPRATNGSVQSGKAYLVFGSANFNNVNVASVDITQTSLYGLRTITFTNTLANSQTGASVASAGSFFQTANPSVAIGAPNASLGGFASNGAVYVVPNNVINASSGTIDLSTIGQTGGTSGVVFVGTSSNGATGTSVSTAGDFNKDGVGDLLIGTPNSSVATLIYGSSSLLTKNADLVSSGTTTRGIWLNRIPGELSGIQFTGNNDLTGRAVALAGDFNNDSISDILIGSPNFGGANGVPTNAGRATIVYGTATTYSGSVSMDNLPSQLGNAQLIGEQSNSYTGYSLSPAGYVNSDSYSDILIGAPGYAGNVGRAYVIPGNPGLYGSLSLINSETNPYLESVVITTSATGGAAGTQVGLSVGGYYRTQTSGSRTVDADNLFDVMTSVPGLTNGGAVYLTQGTYLNAMMPTPKPNIITTDIGVDALPTAPQPYRISATTPSTMNIYVLSVTAANSPTGVAFQPLSDIVATSIVVNGVSYPGATVLATSPADINGDGIPDALVQISPRSNLNLVNGAGTITISGLTNNSSRWDGTADVFVVGGSSPTPGPNPVSQGVRNSIAYKQSYNPPANGESPLPSPSTLSRFNWKPLRYQVAYQQFRPNRYLQLRSAMANGTANKQTVQAVLNGRRNLYTDNPVWGHKSVFTRNVSIPRTRVGRTIPVRLG